MVIETGDKTYESRLARYNAMRELETAGKSLREIGEAFPSSPGKPLTRQAVHKILSREGVKPAGRPRGPLVRSNDGGGGGRARVEAKIEKWHAKLLESNRVGNAANEAKAKARLIELRTELLNLPQ